MYIIIRFSICNGIPIKRMTYYFFYLDSCYCESSAGAANASGQNGTGDQLRSKFQKLTLSSTYAMYC